MSDKTELSSVRTRLRYLLDSGQYGKPAADALRVAVDIVEEAMRREEDRGTKGASKPDAALSLAVRFHETYERLAPQFGYETRPETRAFDPTSKNGRLMVAVCAELRAAVESEEEPRESFEVWHAGECPFADFYRAIGKFPARRRTNRDHAPVDLTPCRPDTVGKDHRWSGPPPGGDPRPYAPAKFYNRTCREVYEAEGKPSPGAYADLAGKVPAKDGGRAALWVSPLTGETLRNEDPETRPTVVDGASCAHGALAPAKPMTAEEVDAYRKERRELLGFFGAALTTPCIEECLCATIEARDARIKALDAALQNTRALAARGRARKEPRLDVEELDHLLRFCREVGIVGDILREGEAMPVED